MKVETGILVTGSGGYPGERKGAVEVLRDDGTPLCSLPDLPFEFWGHTQHGLTTCGGTHGLLRRSCYTFNTSTGTWDISYRLNEDRTYHTKWQTPRGVMLLGGQVSNIGVKSTELLMEVGEDTLLNTFELNYPTT